MLCLPSPLRGIFMGQMPSAALLDSQIHVAQDVKELALRQWITQLDVLSSIMLRFNRYVRERAITGPSFAARRAGK